MRRPAASARSVVACCAGVAALGLVAVSAGTDGVALAGPLLLAGLSDDGFWQLVGWIGGGAALGGAVAYGVATLAAPSLLTVALVFGIAIGGGAGALVRVFAVGDTEAQEPESVTVTGSSDDGGSPDPQPADLFDEHPDPVLYYDDAGEGPVVRAVNDAFEVTFGVGTDAVANAALADASMATDRVDDVVDAASSGEPFDAVITCETDGDRRQFRLRTAAVTDGAGTRGYLLYTPVE